MFIYACDYEARRRRGWGPGRLSGGDAMSDVSPVASRHMVSGGEGEGWAQPGRRSRRSVLLLTTADPCRPNEGM